MTPPLAMVEVLEASRRIGRDASVQVPFSLPLENTDPP
jgi:hypothetical protein